MENLPEKCPKCGSENLVFAAYVFMEFKRDNGEIIPVNEQMPALDDTHGGNIQCRCVKCGYAFDL